MSCDAYSFLRDFDNPVKWSSLILNRKSKVLEHSFLTKKLSSARDNKIILKNEIIQKKQQITTQKQYGHFGIFWSIVPFKLAELGQETIFAGENSRYSGMQFRLCWVGLGGSGLNKVGLGWVTLG